MQPGTPHKLFLAFAIGMAMGTGGCKRRREPPMGGSTQRPPGPRASRASPASDAAPDFVEQQMAMRIGQYAQNLQPIEGMLRGTLQQGEARSHAFEIAAGHCYRIIAVGGVDVNDLDLSLFGPDGAEIDADTQTDNYPVIGRSRPVCPPAAGRYRLEVRMYDGHGDYGVQVFGTP